MKPLLLLSLALSALYACQRDELPAAGVRFQLTPTDSAGTPAKTYWRYAKYRFTLAEYEDVLVAVRVEVNEDNEAIKLEVKDLTAGKEDWEVEEATLTGEMDANGNYAFSGTSQLNEGGTDYGGKYSGTLTVTDGSVADNGCCGKMEFTSTEQGKVTLTGTKLMEAFSAEDWTWDDDEVDMSAEPSPASSAECEDFKLVLSGLKNVRRDERFDFTVAAKSCDDSSTSNFNGNTVTLEYKTGKSNWMESRRSGKKLDDPSTHTYKKHRFGVKDNSKTTYQFKASVEKDGDSYATESDTFDLNPITDIDDGSCAGDYSLKVSKQPMNTKVEVTYTFEVTLECDGAIVSDIAEDRAASAPITLVKFKASGMDDWADSNMIKDKEVAGALDGGEKEFRRKNSQATTDLQYRIGVTINGEDYMATTDTFNITE